MLQILSDFPDNVVAAAARGVVTRRDYQDMLVPRVEATLKRHRKIRCYYELGSQFSGMEAGAIWEDFKIGVEHFSRWERVAVVSDVAWVKYTVQALRLLIPGEIRVFTTSQTPEGLAWVADVKWRTRRPVPMLAVNSSSPGSRAFMPAPQYLHRAP